MKQRILFLYLNTGGGHISGARALQGGIERLFPDQADCRLLHGFPPHLKVERFFMEDGYAIAVNWFPPAYRLIYNMNSEPAVFAAEQKITSFRCARYLASYIKREGITKVVNLHFILEKAARDAIAMAGGDIPLVTIVMDPFTVPPIWFSVTDQDFVVFSGAAERAAIEAGADSARVARFPLMLRKEFEKPFPPERIPELKARHGFDPNRPLLLLAGGGDGLPRSDQIVAEAVRAGLDCQIAVVCGKNKVLRNLVSRAVHALRAANVKVFGFVDFMADLMGMADVIITKGGPATVMESLALRKPLIISFHIYGQEKGNVDFAVDNGVGFYITSPRDIALKAGELLGNVGLRQDLVRKIDALGIRNGLDDIASHVFRLGT